MNTMTNTEITAALAAEGIVATKISHRNQHWIKLEYAKDGRKNNAVRQVPGYAYSKTHGAWLIPGNRKAMVSLLEELGHKTEVGELNAETIKKIDKYIQWLRSKRYSESTVKTYTEALTVFLRYYWNKPVSEISNQDVITFNNDFILKNKFSASYQNQVVNAIKLFFDKVEGAKLKVDLVHRPKRPNQLPNVLSKEEVKELFTATQNLKHKTMLSLIYSCGLRCGELLKLMPQHIDSKRNVLIIKQAKGQKDRIAPLSDKTIEILRDYYAAFKPIKFLFEGQIPGEAYDARSLQLVLKQSLAKTKIIKPVTLHWLRHSYATHLLESGTDLRYIQEILGHKSSKTTEIYTHVSTQSIQKIVSPFDTL